MNLVKAVAKKTFGLVPQDNDLLLKFSQRYLDRHNGENNSDSATNGEDNLLKKLLPSMKNRVVFDVGANVGNWSSFALSVEPTLSMHLFEPSLNTYQKMCTKTWPLDMCLNNIGLGEREETLELNIVNPDDGMNSLYERHGVESAKVSAKEAIQITTLDAYCEKHGIYHVDFMKVDVEGHELAVFKGAKRLLEQGAIDIIQFEYGGCNLDARVYLLDIIQLLFKNGFQIAKIHPNNLKPIKTYTQEMENFRYSNYIAYRDIHFIKSVI
jgi:FkbM family methyltransferase